MKKELDIIEFANKYIGIELLDCQKSFLRKIYLKEKNIMAKFKVGDKVRVKKNLHVGESYHGVCFCGDMKPYLGKILTIALVDSDGDYHVMETGNFWSDGMFESTPVQFTKADLKDGMVVETRESYNNRYLVLGDRLVQGGNFIYLDSCTDDLKETNNNSKFNIDKIYKPFNLCRIENIFKDSYLELIWERPEEETHKEMTVEEIEKELGYKIKIVADKE